MTAKALSGEQVEDAGLAGWTFLLHYGTYGLETRIHTNTFVAGVDLVAAITKLAQELDRPVDLDLRQSYVTVRLNGDGDGSGTSGVTEQDVRFARQVSDLAKAANAELECASVSHVELALDSPNWRRLAGFWAAIVNGEVVADGDWADVGDKNHGLPLIWFQPSGSEEPRQRWHPDILVDPSQLQPRIDAALAAGGELISGDAVSGCTLSDPEGNKVCLATWRGRGV